MKIALDSVGSGYNLDVINANFTKIAQALNDKVLWRNAVVGEPNELLTNVDINGKRLYNLGAPISASDAVRLQDVQSMVVGIVPASLVPFTPYGGISATTVQGAIQELDAEKLSGAFVQTGSLVVSTVIGRLQSKATRLLSEYGALGDGITDDYDAVNTALGTEAFMDGEFKTYKINSPLSFTGKNVRLKNATLDFRGMPANVNTYGLTVAGSETDEQPLSLDAATGSRTIQIASAAAYSAEDWIWIQSDAYWDDGTNTVIGFISRVRSKSGNVLTLYEQTPYGVLVADNARVTKITPVTPYFENVKMIGVRFENPGTYSNPVTHKLGGLKLSRTYGAIVTQLDTTDANYAGVVLDRSIATTVQTSRFNRAMTPGLSYGVVVANGCFYTMINGCIAREVRHGVTVGGSGGVNRFTIVSQNMFHELRDAGADAHAASDWFIVTNNMISTGSRADGTSVTADAGPPIVEGNGGLIGDAITCQSGNFLCANNVLLNFTRYGVFYQCTGNQGGSVNITSNMIRASNTLATSDTAIYVVNQTNGSALIASCRISDNVIRGSGENPIFVYAKTGNITGINISDNDTSQFSTSVGGVLLRTGPGFTISKGVIGNNYVVSGGAYTVFLQGDATGYISDIHLTSNLLDGGTIGLRTDYCNGVTTSGNRIINSTTPRSKTSCINTIFGDDMPLGPERTADVGIVSGAVTVPHAYITTMSVDTEGLAITDDLTTINGGVDGQILVIQAASSARDVVMKDGTGNLQLAGDFTLTHVYDTITLMYRASMWREISRSDTTA